MRRLLVIIPLALAALVIGLVVGHHASGPSGASGQTASTTGTTGTSTLTTVATTATQAQVTIDQTPTVPVADLPGHNRPTIEVGDGNTPQQFILGALYSAALTQEGFSVLSNRNIGPISDAQLALQQGSLSIYPAYMDSWPLNLGSFDCQAAHRCGHFDSAADAYTAATIYADRHGLEVLAPTPASDTAGLAVTTQFATQNRLVSQNDLVNGPLLTFGLPLGFGGIMRAEREYGFRPAVVQYIGIGSQYSELDSGNIQIAYVNTTDPQLAGPRYTLLSDPKHVFGYGNIIPVTTKAVVRAEGPAFVRAIDRVDALLTIRALQGLNSEMQLSGENANFVANEFLQGNGILPAVHYSRTS